MNRMKAKSNQSVLVVEDDDQVRHFLVNALKYLGFRVTECGTVTTASRFLNRADPDLILADCNLPEKSGCDLIKDARDIGKSAPVIGMSAEHFRGAEMLQAGARAFIEKPIHLEKLREVVSETMEPDSSLLN